MLPTVRIPIPPKPGEQWLYVVLDDLEHTSLGDCLRILYSLGYKEPRLAYFLNEKTLQVYLCLLLAVKEVKDADDIPLFDEWSRVGVAFGEDCNAVRAPKRAPIPIAA